jgi:hypothetical protein
MAENDEFLSKTFSSEEDVFRCRNSLVTLAQRVNRKLILTGSLAVAWHVTRTNRRVEKGSLNDIDLVIENLADLPQSLRDDFLVAHFHPTRGRGKLLLQLVDREHRVRIDLFTPFSASLITRVEPAKIAGIACSVVAAEDLTARLLSTLFGVTAGECVDPKYHKNFNLLSGFVDQNRAREIWSDYRKADYPQSFDEASEGMQQKLADNPALLCKDSYEQNVEAICPWCRDAEPFPVSPRTQIFDVLGYV